MVEITGYGYFSHTVIFKNNHIHPQFSYILFSTKNESDTDHRYTPINTDNKRQFLVVRYFG